MARRVMAIPATSAPSERVFSSTGLMVSKRRASLDPERIQASVRMRHNNSYGPLALDSSIFEKAKSLQKLSGKRKEPAADIGHQLAEDSDSSVADSDAEQ